MKKNDRGTVALLVNGHVQAICGHKVRFGKHEHI
jgi:hypothetical protein